MTEQTEAAPHKILQDGEARPSSPVSHAVKDCPPTAGAAVKAAANVPARIVVLRSRRFRGRAFERKDSISARFCFIRFTISSFDTVIAMFFVSRSTFDAGTALVYMVSRKYQ
jgi:hypothetical protein